MRLTTIKAEGMFAKLDRARRTTTNLKNELRAMWPNANGGDRAAIEDLQAKVIAAEHATEQAALCAESVMHRMGRIAAARKGAGK